MGTLQQFIPKQVPSNRSVYWGVWDRLNNTWWQGTNWYFTEGEALHVATLINPLEVTPSSPVPQTRVMRTIMGEPSIMDDYSARSEEFLRILRDVSGDEAIKILLAENLTVQAEIARRLLRIEQRVLEIK